MYIASIFENGKGFADNFINILQAIRNAFNASTKRQSKDNYSPIESEIASALWMLQIFQRPNASNHVFTDSYHTRHVLARSTSELTAGRVKVTGKL